MPNEVAAETILQADDPLNQKVDRRNKRAREILIFMEESKIWQEMVTACVDRSGVASYKNCKNLYQLLEERMNYYKSNYNDMLLPKLSPGLPEDVRNIK
jgi:hypothetical protein